MQKLHVHDYCGVCVVLSFVIVPRLHTCIAWAGTVAYRDVSALSSWLTRNLGLSAVAAEAQAVEIDGATALEMDKEDWQELGATGIQSAKIVGNLKKLS